MILHVVSQRWVVASQNQIKKNKKLWSANLKKQEKNKERLVHGLICQLSLLMVDCDCI